MNSMFPQAIDKMCCYLGLQKYLEFNYVTRQEQNIVGEGELRRFIF